MDTCSTSILEAERRRGVVRSSLPMETYSTYAFQGEWCSRGNQFILQVVQSIENRWCDQVLRACLHTIPLQRSHMSREKQIFLFNRIWKKIEMSHLHQKLVLVFRN